MRYARRAAAQVKHKTRVRLEMAVDVLVGVSGDVWECLLGQRRSVRGAPGESGAADINDAVTAQHSERLRATNLKTDQLHSIHLSLWLAASIYAQRTGHTTTLLRRRKRKGAVITQIDKGAPAVWPD
jgi:hypothetical protein